MYPPILLCIAVVDSRPNGQTITWCWDWELADLAQLTATYPDPDCIAHSYQVLQTIRSTVSIILGFGQLSTVLRILPGKYWDIPCGNIPNPGRRPTQIQMEDFVRGRRKIIRNILRFHALGPFAYRITAQLSLSQIQVKVTLYRTTPCPAVEHQTPPSLRYTWLLPAMRPAAI